MCRNDCMIKCFTAFGAGLIVSSFTEGGFILFVAGAAVILLSLAVRNCC
ncbi:MAG: hypothetical protein VZR27_03465 [Acutalibacteraceae bacterium]|nr:hypothetical protein [Clostridia bacterium]MEE3449748.1 hypothetical protein [Acutalibacteraceae bacterium]